MSYLSDLQWKSSNLKTQKKTVENELRNLNNRASEVRTLIKNLGNVGDSDFYYVNQYANKITENISFALSGTRGTEAIADGVEAGLENSTAYDGKLASGLSELNRELTRVDSRISELESQLANIKSNISSVDNEIYNERKRRAEEEMQKAWETFFG